MKSSIRLDFGKELLQQAKRRDFMVFNADTLCCGLEHFQENYPDRCFTFGIAEQNMMAAAAGAALCGEKVVLATFAVFASMRACEQLRTFICYPNLDVTVLATHGGLLTGSDGATHIAVEDISLLRAVPNLTIVEPSDSIAGRRLAEKALDFHRPLYIRFPKEQTPMLHDSTYDLKVGEALCVREGSDVTLIACGWLLSRAIEAANVLEEQGFHPEVLEMHTIKPIDKKAVIKTARRTGAIVTIEDNSILGGLGSAVTEIVCEIAPVPVQRIGILDHFASSGAPDDLYRENRMTTADIVAAAKKAMQQKEQCK